MNAKDLFRKIELTSDQDTKQYTVGNGQKRMNFLLAFAVASAVYKKTGYAIINLSQSPGHRIGIAEIGKSGIWLI